MGRYTGVGSSQRAAEQAARWLVRLDGGECSAAELEAFERWMGGDPLNAAEYRQAQATWSQSGAVIRGSAVLARASRQAMRDAVVGASQARHHSVGWLSVAATFAIGVGAVIFHASTRQTAPAGTRYSTTAGEQRDIVLFDGSLLTLDTQTMLVERYGIKERRVDLLHGQVQFEVKGDRDRPFVVHASGGTVTATGTRFQVRVGATEGTVTLLEGVVHVAARDAHGLRRVDALVPGQRVRLDSAGRMGDVEPADLKVADGWPQGKLYVDNWTLQDFVAEVNRYSAVKFRIDDPLVGEVRLSGVFQTREQEALERVLDQGWGIRSRRVADNEILLTRR